MASVKKYLLFSVLFALLTSLYAAETILVPENSPLFELNNKRWTIKAVAQRDFQAEIIKKEKIFLAQEQMIGLFTDVYYLKTPGTNGLCYFPEVTFKKGEEGNFIPSVDKIDSLMFLGIFAFVIGLAALAGYFRLGSEKKNYLLPAALVFFVWGFASWYIGFTSNFLVSPSDDIAYFNIAKSILAGKFISVKYTYPIGFPLLCIPFIILFHLQKWTDFILIYMNFQTFVLIPCLFLVLYRFFHAKMGFSRLRSFFSLLLWLALLSFYLPITLIMDRRSPLYVPEIYFSSACFSFLEANSLSLVRFTKSTWLGRNAMGDYAVFFLLTVLLYVSMKKSRSLIRFFALSMGFGFLCLIRINYIFFAPLLAFIFYDSFSGLWKRKWNYLYAVLCGSAGFMIVFGWQFVINKIQFGSPFVWPYSLHQYAPDRGFVWNVVPSGFKFLCQTNYIYIIPGVSSLFFIPERKTRVLLTWWIFPLMLFFCGYPVIFNNSVRFILPLYPALTAAIVMNPVWKAGWSIRIKAVLIVFCSCILCKSNIFFIYFQPWDLGRCGLSNTVFIISQGVICLLCCAVIISMRKDLKEDHDNTIRHFRFLILFTAVFFLGSACIYLAGILILAAFVYGLRDTWVLIRQISGKNGIDIPSLTA